MITCIATTAEARAAAGSRRCSSRRCATTSPARGFAAVETYPEVGREAGRDERRDAGVLGAARVRGRGARRAVPGHAPGAGVRATTPRSLPHRLAAVAGGRAGARRLRLRSRRRRAPRRRADRIGTPSLAPARIEPARRRRPPALELEPRSRGLGRPRRVAAGDPPGRRRRRRRSGSSRTPSPRPLADPDFARNVEAAAFAVAVDAERPRLGRRRATPARASTTTRCSATGATPTTRARARRRAAWPATRRRSIDGRTVYIATCAGGLRTYHAYLPERGVIVSLLSVGERRFGEQLMAGLRP